METVINFSPHNGVIVGKYLSFYSRLHVQHCMVFLHSQVAWIRNTLEQYGSQIEVKHTNFQDQLDKTSKRLEGGMKRDVNGVFNVSDFNRYSCLR